MSPKGKDVGLTVSGSHTDVFVVVLILSVTLAIWLLSIICNQVRRRVVILGRHDLRQ